MLRRVAAATVRWTVAAPTVRRGVAGSTSTCGMLLMVGWRREPMLWRRRRTTLEVHLRAHEAAWAGASAPWASIACRGGAWIRIWRWI